MGGRGRGICDVKGVERSVEDKNDSVCTLGMITRLCALMYAEVWRLVVESSDGFRSKPLGRATTAICALPCTVCHTDAHRGAVQSPN